MKARLVAALAGGLFALGLALSGMTRPEKVRAFLDFFGSWDPSLAFVMGTAIPVYALFYRGSLGRKTGAPGGAEVIAAPEVPRNIDARLLVGALLFGVGWGISGYCPGPALASIAAGGVDVLIFLLSAAAGMWLFRRLSAFVPLDR